MSLPPELRVLCYQLSSTSSAQLPQLLPSLVRNALRCGAPLSSDGGNGAKLDASESAVLIHKLKTKISSLLNGKDVEGRFAAVALVKAVVDVGGWEVLKGVGSWVRDLLGILVKPDPTSTKNLCIITLTSIFLKTHQYQNLVREITTPNLTVFVSHCLNLLSSKAASQTSNVQSSLVEAIFGAFSSLIARHPTIFRPSANQIRVVLRPYLAPTLSDRHFVLASTQQSAQCLSVLLLQTAAKNTSGEEWGKAVRKLVKDAQSTADQVLRAVIEDWESSAGYTCQPVDVSQPLQGGGASETELPSWNGIDAGLQRICGLLRLLQEYFKYPTATAVIVPLANITDLLTRLLSVIPPKPTKGKSEHGGLRLHPAIEREEREGLWAGLPQIHIVCLEVHSVLVDRLQAGFMSLAPLCLDQLIWIFPSQTDNPAFKIQGFHLLAKALPLCGPSLLKPTIDSLASIILTCCKDLQALDISSDGSISMSQGETSGRNFANGSSGNVDLLLRDNKTAITIQNVQDPGLTLGAAKLLPLFFSELPQLHLDGHVRAEMEKTAILTHNKEAMLASILNPYIRKGGRSFPSILPHLCRAFPDDPAVNTLLKPRMPVLVQSFGQAMAYEEMRISEEELKMEDEFMQDVSPEFPSHGGGSNGQAASFGNSPLPKSTSEIMNESGTHPAGQVNTPMPADAKEKPENPTWNAAFTGWGDVEVSESLNAAVKTTISSNFAGIGSSLASATKNSPVVPPKPEIKTSTEEEAEDDSDDESVHLVMEMSDDESDEDEEEEEGEEADEKMVDDVE